MMSLFDRRSAGISLPLFSIRSARSWGVGELPDLPRFAAWMQRGRLRDLALLPLNECALGQESPYAALSAFAIDPLYVSLEEVEDFEGVGSLTADAREALEAARHAPRVRHGTIRWLKAIALRAAHRRFLSGPADGAPHRDFERFRAEHGAWLEDYALFRAIKERLHPSWWLDWPEPLRNRHPDALADARERLADDVSFFEFVQWQAYRQLERARAKVRAHGVRLLGDLPFTVAIDSADAWSRQDEFSVAETLGAPPDPYADQGQDWGLPSYRWETVRASNFAWMRQRAREAARLFDGARVDHVVGLYRSYVLPRDGRPPRFEPAHEDAQRALGEAILRALAEEGLAILAEDLGTVPDWVRHSLAGLGVPGYRVLRWEMDGSVFRDPAHWPELSVATTGTHDTETLAAWWDGLFEEERWALRSIPSLHADWEGVPPFDASVHDAILELLYASPSRLVLLPIQDLFGLRDRINVPGTIGPENWSFRLPWDVDAMSADPFVMHHTRSAAERAARHGR